MKKYKIVLVFSLICLLGGIGILTGGIYLNNKVNYFKENGVLISAKVINVTHVFHKDDSSTYNADVVYIVNEKEYNTDYSTSTYIEEGDFVNIYYDKNNPNINHHTISNIGPIIMIILGSITLIVGIIMLYFLINKNSISKNCKN